MNAVFLGMVLFGIPFAILTGVYFISMYTANQNKHDDYYRSTREYRR
jgi:hypothetical protein